MQSGITGGNFWLLDVHLSQNEESARALLLGCECAPVGSHG